MADLSWPSFVSTVTLIEFVDPTNLSMRRIMGMLNVASFSMASRFCKAFWGMRLAIIAKSLFQNGGAVPKKVDTFGILAPLD